MTALRFFGAVLVATNTRLAPEEVRYICDRSRAKLLAVDSELRSIINPLKDRFETIEEIVTVIDPGLERDTSEGSCERLGLRENPRESCTRTGDAPGLHGAKAHMAPAKDVVVSGGENIATVEVEQAVVSHDAVAEAAGIGVPDEKWGERPKAFAVLAPGQQASKEAIIDHVRSRFPHYKAPDEVVFMDELPKNSAGKVQKFQLREAETAKQARPAEALAG